VADVFSPAQLGDLPLLGDLTESMANALLGGRRLMGLPEVQVLVMERDEIGAVFLLRSSVAKARCYTSGGEEVVLSLRRSRKAAWGDGRA